MPNHVYNTIEIDEEYSTKLESLLDTDEKGWKGGGLFQSVHPMPPSLDISSPQRESDKELVKIAEDNLKKYGHKDWYSWRTDDDNWGNKWGDYETYYDDCVYQFNTAWAPPSHQFLHRLAKIIPSFVISYEEETGWGGHIEFTDGKITEDFFYAEPPFHETDHEDVLELKEDYVGADREVYKAGYYGFWSLQEYLGTDFKSIKAELKGGC